MGGGGVGGVNGNLHDLRDNGKPYYTDNARMDKQCLHCNQSIIKPCHFRLYY